MSTELYAVNNQFRAALLARDTLAARELTRSYLLAARRIRQRILELGERIKEAERAGERVSPSWLYQQRRLAALMQQIEDEIGRFATGANYSITNLQREIAQLGLSHSEQLFVLGNDGAALSGGFARLSAQAATDLAGFAADGSPLADLLKALGPDAAERVKQELFAGIVQGLGPKAIARNSVNALGGNMARALLIARTETLRAYRESSQRFYEANADVIHGWRWVSACNARTCPTCWAMHGSEHATSEQFVSHPGCRCTPVPITDMSTPLKTGPARFAALPEPQQVKILGPLKFGAFKAGRLTLADLVGVKVSRRWGMRLQTRSLADALADRRTKLPRLPKRAAAQRNRRAA